MGYVLLKSDTGFADVDCGVSVAPVMFNWKNRTVTPSGGVSVTVIPTGAVFPDGLFVVEVVEDWLPHPAMKRPTTTVNRARVTLRIFASKFKNLETVKKLAPVFVFSRSREDSGIPLRGLGR
jgi:hypothetical protein